MKNLRKKKDNLNPVKQNFTFTVEYIDNKFDKVSRNNENIVKYTKTENVSAYSRRQAVSYLQKCYSDYNKKILNIYEII